MKFSIIMLTLLLTSFAMATECGVCVCEEQEVVEEDPEEVSGAVIAITIILVIVFALLLAWLILTLTKKDKYKDEDGAIYR